MYDHWFASLISEQGWSQCASILQNDLPESLNNTDYSDLVSRLSEIDTSDERKVANKTITGRKSNNLQEQFLDYIDTDLMPTRPRSNMHYKEWFSFKIKSDSDGNPSSFECRVVVEGSQYEIYYYYDSNKIEVWNKSDKIYITDTDKLPEKIKPFIRSLFRYLRKSFGNSEEPIWISQSDNP